jgi:putative transposase
MDISERTLKRWRDPGGQVAEDQLPEAERAEQPHKLTEAEELAILSACNQPEYRSSQPSQIVPSLADKGLYLASESSF